MRKSVFGVATTTTDGTIWVGPMYQNQEDAERHVAALKARRVSSQTGFDNVADFHVKEFELR